MGFINKLIIGGHHPVLFGVFARAKKWPSLVQKNVPCFFCAIPRAKNRALDRTFCVFFCVQNLCSRSFFLVL